MDYQDNNQQQYNQPNNQPPYQPPYQPGSNTPYSVNDGGQTPPANGLAIASMILGIVSIVCCGIAFIPSLLAVVFGGVAKSKGNRSGMATAGIVLGIIALAFWVIIWIIYGAAILAAIGTSMY